MTSPIPPSSQPDWLRGQGPLEAPGRLGLPGQGGDKGDPISDITDIMDFLNVLKYYYTYISPDPQKTHEMDGFMQNANDIIKDYIDGKIKTPAELQQRIRDLKSKEGFPDMNNPQNMEIFLSAIAFELSKNLDPKMRDKAAEILALQEELAAGHITPEEAQKQAYKIV